MSVVLIVVLGVLALLGFVVLLAGLVALIVWLVSGRKPPAGDNRGVDHEEEEWRSVRAAPPPARRPAGRRDEHRTEALPASSPPDTDRDEGMGAREAPAKRKVAPPAPRPQPAPAPARVFDENVQFTVYRPRVVRPQQWYPLLAFAHLSERPADAPPDTPDPIAEVLRQAKDVLGKQAKDFHEVTQDSRAAVPREGEITFVPEVEGVEFNPPRRTFLWEESVHREEFRLRASPELDGKTVRGRLTVFLGTLILADVALSLRVDSRSQPSTDDPAEQATARPYRKIFASYSHRDADVVRQVEHFCLAMGDQYLRDWTHLRSGEVWNDRLLRLIEEADVFQLFWSRHAMGSAYCKQEWEHALALGRPNFVRPVYWEEPLPTSPDGSLPPEALRRLHFQKLFVESLTHPASLPASAPTPTGLSPMEQPQVPGYELLGELGRGGMGVVDKARQRGLGRVVALKVTQAGGHLNQEERARFQIETNPVARLQHPNIAQVFEVGQHKGQLFYCVEFCPGGSL